MCYVAIHVIEAISTNNLNRGQNNEPKTATVGNVERARISSQCWKREIREHSELEKGIRTRELKPLLAEKIQEIDNSIDEEKATFMAAKLVAHVYGGSKKSEKKKKDVEEEEDDEKNTKSVMQFVSPHEIANLAIQAVDDFNNGEEWTQKDNHKWTNEEINKYQDIQKGAFITPDIALYGRMNASANYMNIDGACYISPALSTNPIHIDEDFFTALDERTNVSGILDCKNDSASTFYRYGLIDINTLKENLKGSKLNGKYAVPSVVRDFLKYFIGTTPKGASHAYGSNSRPQYVYIEIAPTERIGYFEAFNKPITTRNGEMEKSIEVLEDYIECMKDGSPFTEDEKTFVWSFNKESKLGESEKVVSILDKVAKEISNYLEEDE